MPLLEYMHETRDLQAAGISGSFKLSGSLDFQTPNKTKKDVANFLGVTVRTVESLMAHSHLPYYRLGTRRVRFRLCDVLAWMEERNRIE